MSGELVNSVATDNATNYEESDETLGDTVIPRLTSDPANEFFG